MSDSQIDVEDAIAQTIIAICNAVLSRKLDASKEVLAHITSTPLYQIIDQMQQAMCHDVGDILEGCGNDFVDLNLNASQDELRTRNQGVYAAIVMNTVAQRYALYKAIEVEGATTYFVLLAEYTTRTSTGQILLAEAVFTSLLGSFRTRAYRELRLDCLPIIDWNTGLNRSSPLGDASNVNIGQDTTTWRRLRTIDNCLQSGPFLVSSMVKKDATKPYCYYFVLFHQSFFIPCKLAEAWKLLESPQVNVQWDIREDTHPEQWARRATRADEGRRLGIRIYKERGGQQVENWLKPRQSDKQVRVANTVIDLLTDKIVGHDYTWKPTHQYIFTDMDDYLANREEAGAKTPGDGTKRKRVGMEFDDSELIWNDGER